MWCWYEIDYQETVTRPYHTAKANVLVIDRYLEYVLSNIDKENIDNLLPWSKNLPVYLKLNINKK